MNKAEQFLKSISLNDEDYHRLRKDLKELIYGSHDVYSVWGYGSNGKSVFFSIFEKYMDDKVALLPSDYLSYNCIPSHFLQEIANKEYIISQGPIAPMNDNSLKQLVGKDNIIKRKLIIVSNSAYEVPSDELSSYEIPFRKTITEEDNNYKSHQLIDELKNNPQELIEFI